MYDDIIKAIRQGLYNPQQNKGEKEIFVVDTHSKGSFHADISVAHHKDERLPYSLLYFIELKMLKNKLDTSENSGQVFDYFNAIREKQPNRSEFVAILSNFEQSWVYTANYSLNSVSINKQFVDNFVDAIIFANKLSETQYLNKIPELENRFGSQYDVLALSKLHFLLSVPKPEKAQDQVQQRTRRRGKSSSTNDDSWRDPSRHPLVRGSRFVLKIGQGSNSVGNEIAILKKIQSTDCPHLPEIVWSPSGGQQLGIVPVGLPIDFKESQPISRKIVSHLMDGLEFLHRLGIVHRDIRPSNLILDHTKNNGNLVIIDYENAVLVNPEVSVDYYGGYISWPIRLLKGNESKYIPTAEDDLMSSILVVLHMLFPLHFGSFDAREIGTANSDERSRLMNLWEDIEKSIVWRAFMKAAKERDYSTLKGMADVFCHV
jgi:Protein kinase domain